MAAKLFKKNKNVELPHQDELCCEEGSACGYIYKKIFLGRYERRLAVISGDGSLYVYKYYLKGLKEGIPMVGKIYSLNDPRCLLMGLDTDGVVVKLVTLKGEKLTFKLKGEQASAWAAKIVNTKFMRAGHGSHNSNEIAPCAQKTLTTTTTETTDSGKANEKNYRPLPQYLTDTEVSEKSMYDVSGWEKEGVESRINRLYAGITPKAHDTDSRVSYSLTLPSEDSEASDRTISRRGSAVSLRAVAGVNTESEVHSLLINSSTADESERERMRWKVKQLMEDRGERKIAQPLRPSELIYAGTTNPNRPLNSSLLRH